MNYTKQIFAVAACWLAVGSVEGAEAIGPDAGNRQSREK